MLTLQSAARPRHAGRIGIALAGGGPLGAFYELGSLQALSECIEGLDLCELHAYAGVSSGSMLAAGLANGLTPVDIGRIVISNDSGHDPAHPGLFLRPAFREYARRIAAIPRLLLGAAGQYARAPLGQSIAELLAPFAAAMPAGVFDSAPFERYLRKLYGSGGRSNDFQKLRRRLFIVATNLNSGEPALFGEPGLDHVPISRAVQASAALPGLYAPVEIEGETYADGALLRTMHASVVLEAGADLLFCINPLVPFDGSDGGSSTMSTRARAATCCGVPMNWLRCWRATACACGPRRSTTPLEVSRPRWNGNAAPIVVSHRICRPRWTASTGSSPSRVADHIGRTAAGFNRTGAAGRSCGSGPLRSRRS